MKVCSNQRFDQKCRPGNKKQLIWVKWDAGYWVTELTLSIRSQFLLQSNCYEMLWLHIDKGRLQGIPQNFYCNYPKNSLSRNSVYQYRRMASYDLLLFMLKIEISTRGTNSMPFLVFRRDQLRSTSWIICGSGSYLRSNLGIISGLRIICGRG